VTTGIAFMLPWADTRLFTKNEAKAVHPSNPTTKILAVNFMDSILNENRVW